MNEDFPKNEVEFDLRFHTEQACLSYQFHVIEIERKGLKLG